MRLFEYAGFLFGGYIGSSYYYITEYAICLWS